MTHTKEPWRLEPNWMISSKDAMICQIHYWEDGILEMKANGELIASGAGVVGGIKKTS